MFARLRVLVIATLTEDYTIYVSSTQLDIRNINLFIIQLSFLQPYCGSILHGVVYETVTNESKGQLR